VQVNRKMLNTLFSFLFPQILGSIYLLKGRILEALDNRALASEAFKEALRVDAYCIEAFRALISHEILTAEEERELLSAIPIASQSDSSG
jgi:anaphase-promoting complex subunit 6